jgi:hypothetical protein
MDDLLILDFILQINILYILEIHIYYPSGSLRASSLKKLAENFNVTNKGIFPFKFVNHIYTALDYIGKVPNFKYFEGLGISLEEYNNYSKDFKFN